jgi:hypothetical protein
VVLQPSASVSSKSCQNCSWNEGKCEPRNSSERSEEKQSEDEDEEEICSELEAVPGKDQTEDTDEEIPFLDEAGNNEPEYGRDTLIKPDGSRQALTFKHFSERPTWPCMILPI